MTRFKRQGSGHIVNIASVAGKGGFPGGATYCATKHGVVGYSEAVRFELRGTGVEVSCVMPGIVNTELAAGLKDARFVKKITPEDVAEAIVGALEQPYFDVFVPKSTGPITQFMAVWPRSVRERISVFLKADRVLIDAAHGQERAAYEKRAAESTPAAEEAAREKAARLRAFDCPVCTQRLFFENSRCLHCGTEVAFSWPRREIVALRPPERRCPDP